MNVNNMKNTAFEPVSLDDWKAKAEESLKGKPLEKLFKETYEGITLKPLYTKEDRKSEWSRNRESGRKGWKIAQRVHAEDSERLPELLQHALRRGQDTVSFADDNQALNKEVLQKIFSIASEEDKPLFHSASISSEGFITLKEVAAKIKGIYAADPITELLEGEMSEEVQNWLKNITYLKDKVPGLRTVLVDTSILNESGANAIQELAYSIAAGVAYLEMLKKQGWTTEEAAGKIVFNFSIGSNFFMEIGKLRAFRLLWKNVLTAYGAVEESVETVISAETSAFTKSKLDSYVNMLRAGNETFSAVLGGADYIHVSPFDEVFGSTSAFSERIARNTQLILSQEAHLNKVSDPSGGSYYIESMTHQLAEGAWKRFQEIEQNGGLLETLKEDTLQKEIQSVLDKRKKDTSIRKQSLIGTNVYANLEETLKGTELSADKPSKNGFHPERLSQSFENLRGRAVKLKEKPAAGLILLGKIKNHKARADFVTGFLSAGGIGIQKSKECLTVEDAVQFVSQSQTGYYVICGRDEDYEMMAEDIIKSIKAGNDTLIVDLAGRLNESEMSKLSNAGLDDSIYLGQQMIEKLDMILSRWEGDTHGK